MPTVLVVDDDVVLLARLASQLDAAGYRALQAGDVRYAEHLLAGETIDLLLIDPGVGRGEGWALLERLAPQIPVIAIGDGREELVIRGLSVGAADYIAKPVRTGELMARVRGRLRAASAGSSADVPTTPLGDGAPSIPPPLYEPAQPPAAPAPRPRGDEEEPVFASHAEEQRLIHGDPPSRVDELDREALSRLPLGERLKSARQRRRITLVQAELDTRLRMSYIQAMEEEKFALLPRGPVSEAMLRSYAAYLGLDASRAAEEFRRTHASEPVEPPVALGGLPLPRRIPRWIPIAAAVLLALLVGGGGIWLLDPGGVTALAGRARALVVPPTATATPTITPSPTVTPTITPSPTASSTPSPTITPSRTPSPTSTGVVHTRTPTPAGTPTATPRGTQTAATPTRAP